VEERPREPTQRNQRDKENAGLGPREPKPAPFPSPSVVFRPFRQKFFLKSIPAYKLATWSA
jgi:hypothetical protein